MVPRVTGESLYPDNSVVKNKQTNKQSFNKEQDPEPGSTPKKAQNAPPLGWLTVCRG